MSWYNAVRAVLSQRGMDPYLAATSVEELAAELNAGATSRLSVVMTALSRPLRITKGDVSGPVTVDESLFQIPEEGSLWRACNAVRNKVRIDLAVVSSLVLSTVYAYF